MKWAEEWGREWVVVETHPGATEVIKGALSIAHVVVTPVPLRSSDLDGTEHIVRELADYPVVLIPNFVPSVAPVAEVRRLGRMIEGTPRLGRPADPGRTCRRNPQAADGHHLQGPT